MQLRLYLRDRPRNNLKIPFFLDDELEFLVDSTASIEEATSLGWLLKAGSTADSPTTVTIGQMSETRGQATESYNVCMAMYNYWLKKAQALADPAAGVARWMQIVPDEGTFVGDLLAKIDLIDDYFDSDISRLTL
jgi:hypothetical protein